MKVADIIAAVEEFAPAIIQDGRDNTGLQIGSPQQEVHGVLTGLDCTEELVAEAVRRGCDMILTHHPLLYNGIRHIDPAEPVGAAVAAAIRAGVAVYAAHTSADKVLAGVSGAMARRLGLLNIRVLAPEGILPGTDGEEYGFGAVGDLPEPLSCAEASALIKKAFGLSVLRTSAPIDGPVDRIAVCGGSGAPLLPAAIASGARIFLCGDISYHNFFVPEGFMLADAGHFETEVEIVKVLHSVLRKKFPNFVSLVSESEGKANPVNYL